MTFDEWFATQKYDESNKQLMRAAWVAASNIRSRVPGERPRENDVWIVRVNGGKLESCVLVTRVSQSTVWLTDNDRRTSRARERRIEDLDWLRKVASDLK